MAKQYLVSHDFRKSGNNLECKLCGETIPAGDTYECAAGLPAGVPLLIEVCYECSKSPLFQGSTKTLCADAHWEVFFALIANIISGKSLDKLLDK